MDHIALQIVAVISRGEFKMNWQENQDSLMVERQALEVRVRIPVQVQIFLLKFNN